ncbi:MAG: DegT/DnrJ/EryC1/StrS family aminotransferase [Ruminococcaceae bacterium]|nr:DegT/DnrJ/EryC1/StrS family aminotransferase [Oscillospiraceae bacterium]
MIRLIWPYIQYEDVEQAFREIFDSGMFTRGQWSQALPRAVCAYTGARYAFNATSATTALSASLEVLGVGPGDEVIVGDFSFPASVNVVEACGAVPVFADVDRETFNMLPEELEAKITSKTKAVMFVSALGNPSGLLQIRGICQKHGIPLINDAACAIGSSVDGQKVGSIADIACFSYHPRKLLTSGEGGSITTSNSEWARQLEIKLLHGATVADGKMDFVTYGYNYRLPELQCLMVIKQIEKLDDIVRRRIETQQQYVRLLQPAGYQSQKHDAGVVHNMQSVVFVVPNGVDRDGLIDHLAQRDIESTIGTYCLSNTSYYKAKYNSVQPTALWLEQNTITLPCYDGVDAGLVAREVLAYTEGKGN